jgi:hypothetical protein
MRHKKSTVHEVFIRQPTSSCAVSIMETGDDCMHKELIKALGLSAATAALALFAYGASAQDKAPAPAKKAACSKLKEADCTARTDCVFTAAVVDEKTKKTKTKASCKAGKKQ